MLNSRPGGLTKAWKVCEAHSEPGGAAHAWQRGGYTFESGPSLYSGMTDRPSPNPITNVLEILEEPVDCHYYNTWMWCVAQQPIPLAGD